MTKRKVMGSILLFLGIISGLYCVLFYLSYKKITFGIDIILLVSIMSLLNAVIKFNNKKRNVFFRYCEKFMDFIIIIIAITFLTGEMLIQNGIMKKIDASSGSMVIIGYTNAEDEETINERVSRAYDVYYDVYKETKYFPIIIVSNKIDKNLNEGKYDKRSVEIREKMYEKGIKRYSIKLENEEYTLLENLKNVKEYLETKNGNAYNIDNIRVVTSDYNVFLTSLIGQEMGLSIQAESVHTPFLKAPQAHVREYFEIYKTFFFELIPYMEER